MALKDVDCCFGDGAVFGGVHGYDAALRKVIEKNNPQCTAYFLHTPSNRLIEKPKNRGANWVGYPAAEMDGSSSGWMSASAAAAAGPSAAVAAVQAPSNTWGSGVTRPLAPSRTCPGLCRAAGLRRAASTTGREM